MEINKVIYFSRVYEFKSIRKAAEAINMSAGSLSKSIKSLESELDIKLFIPDGRNIIATDSAHKLYQKSQVLIQAYHDFNSEKEELKQNTSIIRIGSWEIFTTYFIAQFCRDEVSTENFEIEVLEKTPHALEKSILENEIDIGISYAPITHPDLEYYKISKMKFGVFGNNCFKSVDFENWPFAVPIHKVNNSITNIQELDNWPSEIKRKIKYKFEMLETALEIARDGLGVIHCPMFIIPLQNKKLLTKYQLVELPLTKSFPKSSHLDIYLITRKSFPENSIVKKLAKSIRIYC